MKKQIAKLAFLIATISATAIYAQTPADTSKVKHITEIKGYVGLVHPLYTLSKEGNVPNFRDYYIVGNPWGINFWKTKKFGLSFEFTPFLRDDRKGSRISNVLFHPGVLYKIGHEFTVIGRAAYETSGRYGFTPILNKVVWRNEQYSIFTAVLLPVRFGNGHATSYTAAFQFGVGF